ncbi:mCG58483 [Mus musculus]|nr:mCG58483 [Mus musculus]
MFKMELCLSIYICRWMDTHANTPVCHDIIQPLSEKLLGIDVN